MKVYRSGSPARAKSVGSRYVRGPFRDVACKIEQTTRSRKTADPTRSGAILSYAVIKLCTIAWSRTGIYGCHRHGIFISPWIPTRRRQSSDTTNTRNKLEFGLGGKSGTIPHTEGLGG